MTAQPKLLVVDDEPDIGVLVSNVARRLGLQVIAKERGRDFLDVIETERPDLLCIDMILPDMDGRQIIAELGKKKLGIPALIMSGYHGLDDSELDKLARMHGLTCYRYLHKPASLSAIRTAFEELLASSP